jgi:hypothetical protein
MTGSTWSCVSRTCTICGRHSGLLALLVRKYIVQKYKNWHQRRCRWKSCVDQFFSSILLALSPKHSVCTLVLRHYCNDKRKEAKTPCPQKCCKSGWVFSWNLTLLHNFFSTRIIFVLFQPYVRVFSISQASCILLCHIAKSWKSWNVISLAGAVKGHPEVSFSSKN